MVLVLEVYRWIMVSERSYKCGSVNPQPSEYLYDILWRGSCRWMPRSSLVFSIAFKHLSP